MESLSGRSKVWSIRKVGKTRRFLTQKWQGSYSLNHTVCKSEGGFKVARSRNSILSHWPPLQQQSYWQNRGQAEHVKLGFEGERKSNMLLNSFSGAHLSLPAWIQGRTGRTSRMNHLTSCLHSGGRGGEDWTSLLTLCTLHFIWQKIKAACALYV